MRRPWNIIDCPVYSLATYNAGTVNMNICTYVTAVSMQPKLFAIAVYEETKTLFNLQSSDVAVLQLLQPDQIRLIKHLGRKSGLNFDKEKYLQKNNLLENWNNLLVLQNVSARILVRKIHFIETGDHTLFLFEVVKYQTLSEKVLQFQELITQKVIL